jgi:hypothetical protein
VTPLFGNVHGSRLGSELYSASRTNAIVEEWALPGDGSSGACLRRCGAGGLADDLHPRPGGVVLVVIGTTKLLRSVLRSH